MVAAGERCSWPRPVLSFPREAVGGWWIVHSGPAGSFETAWLCECRWLLALASRRISGVYDARLWASPSESGVAVLLVGDSDPVGLCLQVQVPCALLVFNLTVMSRVQRVVRAIDVANPPLLGNVPPSTMSKKPPRYGPIDVSCS